MEIEIPYCNSVRDIVADFSQQCAAMVAPAASPTDTDKQLCAALGSFLPFVGGSGDTSAAPQEYTDAARFVRSLPCLRIELTALPALVSLSVSFVASLLFSLAVAHAASAALLGEARAEAPSCVCCGGRRGVGRGGRWGDGGHDEIGDEEDEQCCRARRLG